MITFTVTVPDEHAPALRSVVDDMSAMIGMRLEKRSKPKKEAALTRAASALGALRAATNAAIPEGDSDYVR